MVYCRDTLVKQRRKMGTLQFRDSPTVYATPPLGLEKELLLDDKGPLLYRLVMQFDKQCESSFTELLNNLDARTHNRFIEGFQVEEDDTRITFKMIYVSKTIKPYGIFYDLESDIEDVVFTTKGDYDNSGRTIIAENKKTVRKRKTTGKIISK